MKLFPDWLSPASQWEKSYDLAQEICNELELSNIELHKIVEIIKDSIEKEQL
jgi:hypothetical protein